MFRVDRETIEFKCPIAHAEQILQLQCSWDTAQNICTKATKPLICIDFNNSWSQGIAVETAAMGKIVEEITLTNF